MDTPNHSSGAFGVPNRSVHKASRSHVWGGVDQPIPGAVDVTHGCFTPSNVTGFDHFYHKNHRHPYKTITGITWYVLFMSFQDS